MKRDERFHDNRFQRPPTAFATNCNLLMRLITLATLLEILFLNISEAAYLTSSRSFPFKTSFVSSSDNTQLRRNGALASLQLANLEQANQQYPMLAAESLLLGSDSASFDTETAQVGSSDFEPQYGASDENQQNSNQRDRTLTQLIGADSSLVSPTGAGLSSSSGDSADATSNVHQSDDLLAISSNNNNQTVANETSTTLSTTNTTAATTTTTTTMTPLQSTTTAPAATTTTSTTTAPVTTSQSRETTTSLSSGSASTTAGATSPEPEHVTSNAPTLAPTETPTTQLNSVNSPANSTTIEVINNPEDKPTTTPTAMSTTLKTAFSETANQTTTTTTPIPTTTTTTATTTTTTVVTTRRDRDELKSATERGSRTATERDPAAFGGRIATTTPPPSQNATGTEATVGRGRNNCQNGSNSAEKCARSGTFVVSKVPVFDRWQSTRNSSAPNMPKQVVNEFVFVPEDSMGPLELDQTGFVNVTSSNQQQHNGSDSHLLTAEHRTIDDLDTIPANFTNSSLMLVNDNGEFELDYVNLDPSDDDRPSTLQSDRSVPEGGLNFNPTSDRLKPTTTTSASKPLAKTTTERPREQLVVVAQTQPTSTTTSTTVKPSTTTVVAKDKTRATNTLIITTRAPERSTQTPHQSSITISELQSERLNSKRRPLSTTTTSTQPPVAPNRPVTITLGHQASSQHVRKNNKFLVEPLETRLATSSTVRPRPKLIKLDNLRTASARRLAASSSSQQQQQQQQSGGDQRHKQVFNEPTGDWHRRHHKETFSPINNGADEEEASILTRYSMTSQLSRLSSLDKQQPNSGSLRGPNSERPPARWTASSRRLSSSASERRTSSSSPVTTQPTTTTTTTTSTTSSIRSSVATSTSTSVEWSRPTTTSRPVTTSAQEQLEAVVTELARAQQQRAASDSSRWLKPLESTTTIGSGGDLISKIMDEEDKEEEEEENRELKSTREIVLTLIASSSPAGQPLDRRQSSLLTTTVANVDSKPNLSTSELNLASSSSTASPQTTVASWPSNNSSGLVPAQTMTGNKSDELLVDQAIKEQLERDDVSDNKRPRSVAKSQLANSYKPTSSTLRLAKNQLVVVKPKLKTTTTSENGHDYDSGKWQPDTNLDYSLIQDYETSKQRASKQLNQSGMTNTSPNANGNQQDSLPGRPGVDYPVHWQVPKTSFDCRNYEQIGFYADVESDCQAYHSCHRGRGGRHTFLCPNGTLFSQELLTCDWWYNVECSQSKFYMPNGENNSANSSARGSELTTTTAAAAAATTTTVDDDDDRTGGSGVSSWPPATQTTAAVVL